MALGFTAACRCALGLELMAPFNRQSCFRICCPRVCELHKDLLRQEVRSKEVGQRAEKERTNDRLTKSQCRLYPRQ